MEVLVLIKKSELSFYFIEGHQAMFKVTTAFHTIDFLIGYN